jgi:excisionase family DNA binding protein
MVGEPGEERGGRVVSLRSLEEAFGFLENQAVAESEKWAVVTFALRTICVAQGIDPKIEVRASEEGYWTKDQAAAYLKISDRTLNRWMAAGLIPYFKFGHCTVRFKPADLRAHLDRTSRVLNRSR